MTGRHRGDTGPGVAARRFPRNGAEDMGKHRKKIECSECDSSGKTTVTIDGKNEVKPCQIYKGTGWV